MSRIGKQPIAIPDKTEVSFSDGILNVKGPYGELSRQLKSEVDISIEDKEVILSLVRSSRLARALWGTYAAHVNNMIRGVNEQFEKKLVVEGVGYRVELSGKELTLTVGFSHPIKFIVPEGLEVSVEKNIILIKGVDRDQVGQFAANVRSAKKPEPYKGKGIRYSDEVVRRKQGKKAA